MKTLFTETQKFTQWWIWVIIGGISIIPFYEIIQHAIMDKPFDNNPVPPGLLIVFAVGMVLIALLFLVISLETVITEENIKIKFFPFTSKTIRWDDIETAEVIKYGFVGGWGVRLGTKYGTVYNVKGSDGLHLTLSNGNKLLLGTQKPNELKSLLEIWPSRN